MKITETNNKFNVAAENYSLELSDKRITVFFEGEQVLDLRPETAVNVMEKEDAPVGETTLIRNGDTFIWTCKTECWEKADFVLTPFEDRFEYGVSVTGCGDIKSVEYFIGNKKEQNVGSEYEFDLGFTPIPTVTGARQCEFAAQAEKFDEFSYLTIPPIFDYVFDICGVESKLSMALVAEKGEHNFTKFTYNSKSENFMRRFWLATDQDGHTSVNGSKVLPKILVYPSKSREESLEYYCKYYFDNGIAERKPVTSRPRFWYGPMACGWIEQAAYSIKYNTGFGAPDMAREDLYNYFISEMEKRDLHPKLLIIDDKWQNEYGTAVVNTDKWHDLRGWIDNNLKERNCHTMLWYKLWDAEGLPDDCTMEGQPLPSMTGESTEGEPNRKLADPTNPKYREILRENMHRLLSADEGCYNAAGLKLDFAFFQPVGSVAKSYDGKYGVELYLEYIKVIYEYAKEFKPEAIISGSPCHPLFNGYLDHARLHDYFPDLRRCFEEFTFRAHLYKNAIPDALIDTDGTSFHSRRDTMRHLTMSGKLGIPDLYSITPLPSMELTSEDWAKVAAAWKEYDKMIDDKYF